MSPSQQSFFLTHFVISFGWMLTLHSSFQHLLQWIRWLPAWQLAVLFFWRSVFHRSFTWCLMKCLVAYLVPFTRISFSLILSLVSWASLSQVVWLISGILRPDDGGKSSAVRRIRNSWKPMDVVVTTAFKSTFWTVALRPGLGLCAAPMTNLQSWARKTMMKKLHARMHTHTHTHTHTQTCYTCSLLYCTQFFPYRCSTSSCIFSTQEYLWLWIFPKEAPLGDERGCRVN